LQPQTKKSYSSGFVKNGLIEIEEHDVRTLGRKSRGDAKSNTLSTTCNHRDLALETVWHKLSY